VGQAPEVVADAIVRAIEAPRPRARYTVTSLARWVPRAKDVLPDGWFDRLLRRTFAR
jgi:hypothetical protein